ncbi:hypothetical protein Tco_0730023 [Tanacetum coccineum]|uniref:Uncharacterized protein n=1 Tax=Tanacetum coccineum TaxID=301880 RepID=A0ABQ4YTC9_9ASTR
MLVNMQYIDEELHSRIIEVVNFVYDNGDRSCSSFLYGIEEILTEPDIAELRPASEGSPLLVTTTDTEDVAATVE